MAADRFDPYYKWLGIPPEEQPPTHYRLLGIVQFEADHDVIANAASRQSFHLRQLQTGPQAALAQRLLKEVAAAKAILLDPAARAEYDQSLAPEVGLPTDEIVPVSTFRKKPAKAKGFDPTALLFRLVPVILFAGILAYVLRMGDRKDLAKPASIAAGAPDSEPSDTVGNDVPSGPLSPPADHSAAAVDPVPGGNASAGQPATDSPAEAADEPDAADVSDADREAGAMESAAVEPRAAGTAPPADAVATADMEAGSAFEADSTKEPVPSGDDQSKASKLVRSKYKADFAKAKIADQKAALARTLLAEGREMEDDPTNRYAILMAAIDLATAAGDFQLAVDAWDDLGEHFQVDALAGQWKVLEKSSKTKQVAALKVCLEQFVEESLDQGRYDLARGGLKALLAVSKPEDAQPYESDLKNLDALVARSAEAKSAFEKLKTDPSDPEANRTAGEFLSFFKRDWSQGLLLLSRSGDATLKALARDELAKPDEAKAEVRLADAWWNFAEEQADGRIKASAKSRARFWYMEALPDLQGDERQKAERRATLEARVHRQSAAEANITPQVLKSKFQGKAAYDAEANWLTVVYDFQDPAQLKDFQGDARFSEGEIAVPLGTSVRHVAKFKTLKMTGTVTMKSKTGDVLRGSAGLEAQRDGSSVKVSSGAEGAGSSEKGPADDDLVLPFELDANEKFVLFRLGDEVVGKPMAKSEPGQIQLCGGEAGAQFSQLAISGQPDPVWLADFFGLPKARAEKDSSGAKSSSSARSTVPAKAKLPTKFERVAKVVLWNEHNSSHNNSGTRTANLILRRSGKTVWQKKDLKIPWEPNQPTKLAVDVPQIAADSVRIEVTAWHGESGGLAEVEVLDKADKNLAQGAQVIASAEHRPGDPRNAATVIDGITDSVTESVGYWLPLNGQPGWVDIRLLPQEAPPPAASNPVAAAKQSTATKEPAKAVGKSARKSLDAKIVVSCDDAFEMYVNGQFVLEGKQNETFSKNTSLATGDVITVKASNDQGAVGFCCVIKFANEQLITTSDGWGAYVPNAPGSWFMPAQVKSSGPAIPGSADWPTPNVKKASGVDADSIWAPGGADVCYLFYVVGRLDIAKKKVEK